MSIFDLLPGDLIASTLIQCDNSTADANNMYTFCNEKRGYFSKIDYICYSSALKDFVKSYCTIDSASNHSDHVPVAILLQEH